ncbi:MAG: oxidoreductase [Acidobacteria bacterium]|nr:oxidoreductase [Acidobacteriota bacterium]
MKEIASILPFMLFLFPASASLIVALFGRKKGFLREGISLLGVVLSLVFSCYFCNRTLFNGSETGKFTAFYQNIFIDGFGSLMALLVNVILLLVLLYSFSYMKTLIAEGKILNKNLRFYYTLISAFNATMMLTFIANHLILFFIAIEASTLATAQLVGFFRDKHSLEAAYKYMVLIIVGIAFSLMGCVLIYSASVPHLTGHNAVLLSEIGRIADIIPKNVALLAVAFFIIGFSAKGGLIPFHPWLPDAHSEAPVPVSALLSGLIIKIGVYAFARTVTVFSRHYPVIILYVAAVACISMLLGILLAYAQNDLKRLLAASSISQISYIFTGLCLGSYVGIYGGIFHLVNHSMLKSLLFLTAGSLMFAAKTRSIRDMGGLYKKMPITSVCFFVGGLGIAGMPLFSGFHSKFAIFAALGQQQLWWALAVSVLTGVLTLSVFAWAGSRIFWGRPADSETMEQIKEVPFAMWAPMAIVAGIVLVIGLYPNLIYPILDSASQSILTIAEGGSL